MRDIPKSLSPLKNLQNAMRKGKRVRFSKLPSVLGMEISYGKCSLPFDESDSLLFNKFIVR